MNRDIAACHCASCCITVQRRDRNGKHIGEILLISSIDHHRKVYGLPFIQNSSTCEPGMIPVDHEQLEGIGFETQIGCVILVREVASRRWITPAAIDRKAKGSFEAILRRTNLSTTRHFTGSTDNWCWGTGRRICGSLRRGG